jgi:hypothetical protein
MGDEREKAKLDDQAKAVHAGPDLARKAPAKDIADQDDRLGGLAKLSEGARQGNPEPPATERRLIDDSLQQVIQSFHWLNDSAQGRIESLRSELKKADEPPWESRLAEAMLNVALAAGAAGTAEAISSQLVSGAFPAATEFVKAAYEGGINNGVAAGRNKFVGEGADAVDPFIDSQKEGVRGMHMENQAHFIDEGRHHVKTLQQARELRSACSSDNVNRAAVEQEKATRNVWISYLAQGKYGSIGKRGLDGSITGASTTNMMTQERRDWVNKSAPGFVPDKAPDASAAMRGDAPGVLFLGTNLPNISDNRMEGTPEVEKAILNGLNEDVRVHYTGDVDKMHIPRQIIGNSNGHFPRFTVNLDENGAASPIGHEESAWLRARATAGEQANGRDDVDKKAKGLKLLLEELKVTKAPRGSL